MFSMSVVSLFNKFTSKVTRRQRRRLNRKRRWSSRGRRRKDDNAEEKKKFGLKANSPIGNRRNNKQLGIKT